MASAPSPRLASTAGCRGRGCRRQRSLAASPLLTKVGVMRRRVSSAGLPRSTCTSSIQLIIVPLWQYHIITVEGLSAIASLSFLPSVATTLATAKEQCLLTGSGVFSCEAHAALVARLVGTADCRVFQLLLARHSEATRLPNPRSFERD